MAGTLRRGWPDAFPARQDGTAADDRRVLVCDDGRAVGAPTNCTPGVCSEHGARHAGDVDSKLDLAVFGPPYSFEAAKGECEPSVSD